MTNPSPGTINWDLGHYYPLIRIMAWRLRIDSRLQRRFDASDIANEALMKAVQGLPDFRGTTTAELMKWLQMILHNTYLEMLEKQMADRRTPEMEASIRDLMGDSCACLDRFLARGVPSPSDHLREKEVRDAFLSAIELLPEDQRNVIILRLVYDLPIKQIAQEISKTEKAVAGLLLRGREQLQQSLRAFKG